MKDAAREEGPPGVAVRPTQGGDIRGRWPWVKPEAWTERMLEALENGVKGGKWFSLMDKVYARKNLEVSWEQVRRNRGAAGVDGQSVERFDAQAEKYLDELERELKDGTYCPQAVRRQWIPKDGSDKLRPLGIPTVKDRIVQTALRNAMEPIFEKRFVEESYGFRPGRGCKDALRRVDALLKAGYTHVVDADIQSYFDTIDHELLLEEVKGDIADGKVLELIGVYLKQEVLEDTKAWTPEAGTPQGAVISPLLANIYLHPVDVALKAAGYAMVRYADDLVILCKTEAEARQALERLEAEMIRRHTPRANGHSLQSNIERINPVLRGWFGYFKHSHHTTFEQTDRWVRMRLRSILRKRNKQPGRGRGSDHQRWPNAYFAELGLFSLKEAHAHAHQSRLRTH